MLWPWWGGLDLNFGVFEEAFVSVAIVGVPKDPAVGVGVVGAADLVGDLDEAEDFFLPKA